MVNLPRAIRRWLASAGILCPLLWASFAHLTCDLPIARDGGRHSHTAWHRNHRAAGSRWNPERQRNSERVHYQTHGAAVVAHRAAAMPAGILRAEVAAGHPGLPSGSFSGRAPPALV